MSSTERDDKITPAILELAETRAIARSLRFAGYGVEYCSAEEISHLENGNGNGNIRQPNQEGAKTTQAKPKDGETPKPENGGNDGNGDARITNKQFNYIVNLGRNLSMKSGEIGEVLFQQ